MGKAIIKVDNIEIQKQIFHQYKGAISIKVIHINKIVVSNKVPLDKKDLNVLLATKTPKRLDLHVYFSQK